MHTSPDTFIARPYLSNEIAARIEMHTRIPVDGASQPYTIGKALGYTDALRDVRDWLVSTDDPAMLPRWDVEDKAEQLRAAHCTKRFEGDTAAYDIGHALGYADGLDLVKELLVTLPAHAPQDPGPAWHHS